MFCRKIISAALASKLCNGPHRIAMANTLYTRSALGLDGYELTRNNVRQQYQNLETKFKEKMTEFIKDDSKPVTIFTEDLKHMVHLAEEEDLGLVSQMMVKFAMQNRDLRFGSYVFGPVVMRMYHFLNKPKEALEAFNNPELDGFFDQLVTYQILMDLLLNNGLYDDVIAVFDTVKSKQIQGAKHPKNAVVLVFAACYKKNTKQSFEYAKALWSELTSVGHYPMRKAATFAAALAINQGEPAVGIEILANVKRQSYVTVRNLKVAALADLGRPDDALPILRNVLEFADSPGGSSHTFMRETIDKLEASVEKLKDEELSKEIKAVVKKLNDFNVIVDSNLDDQLCSEIEAVQPRAGQDDRRMQRPQYNRKFGGGRPSVMSLL